jgi:hypothetical protein
LQQFYYLSSADTAWGSQDLHQIEENYKIPKEKTKMGFGKIVCSTTKTLEEKFCAIG